MSRPRKIIGATLALTLAVSTSMAQEETQTLDKRVYTIFQASMDGVCYSLDPESILYPPLPQIYELSFNYANEDYPPRPFRLYEFPCTSGAYNIGNVYFGADDNGEVRQIQFAIPAFDVEYENDGFEAPVKGIKVKGFSAYPILINSEFNPETATLFSNSYWRGLGDAASYGKWVFDEGQFVLQAYDVDASYDGEVNPVRIYGEGQPSR